MNLNEARLMVGPTFHMFVPFKGLLDESSSHEFLRKNIMEERNHVNTFRTKEI